MIEFLKSVDLKLFLLINGAHSHFLDTIMWLASDRFFWIPLYLFFLWVLYRSEKKRFWLTLIFVVLIILLSDQFCNLIKNSVMRLRPSNDPSVKDMVHLVDGYAGGTFGFYSAHASNSIALATFIYLTIKNRQVYLLPILAIYTSLICYSRIYLGVHYPSDVFTGIITGAAIGILASLTYRQAAKRIIKTVGNNGNKKPLPKA
ncbi:MAG: phosphatase PAP2 family protein [Bacteroidetes bacterium]|nr:phosphatase PAP2 family protein [Bacteroidota bacterium]